MFSTNEIRLVEEARDYDSSYKSSLFGESMSSFDIDNPKGGKGKTVLDWCKDFNFYLHGIVYTVVKSSMVVVVSVYPFYLTIVTGFGASGESGDKPTPIQLALVPLISYCSSLTFTLFF